MLEKELAWEREKLDLLRAGWEREKELLLRPFNANASAEEGAVGIFWDFGTCVYTMTRWLRWKREEIWVNAGADPPHLFLGSCVAIANRELLAATVDQSIGSDQGPFTSVCPSHAAPSPAGSVAGRSS